METKSRTRRDQNHWLPKKYSQAVNTEHKIKH